MNWSVGISWVVLAFCFYIIRFRPDDQEARKFAFGAVGFILGYWLR
jgi:hypothetical protein